MFLGCISWLECGGCAVLARALAALVYFQCADAHHASALTCRSASVPVPVPVPAPPRPPLSRSFSLSLAPSLSLSLGQAPCA
eukprot:1658415-Rhodomonas_salina.2